MLPFINSDRIREEEKIIKGYFQIRKTNVKHFSFCSCFSIFVCWSCYPASLCFSLDVFGSLTRKFLSIRKMWSLHIKFCIMFSVSVDVDGYKRGKTSRSVVGNKKQTNSNFKAHMYHYSYLLDFTRRRWIIVHFTIILIQHYTRFSMRLADSHKTAKKFNR